MSDKSILMDAILQLLYRLIHSQTLVSCLRLHLTLLDMLSKISEYSAS